MSEPSLARVLLAVLLLTFLGAPAGAQSDDLYDEEMAVAADHLQRGRLLRAREALRSVLLAVEIEEKADWPTPQTLARARAMLRSIDLREGKYAEVLESIASLPEAERGLRLNRVQQVQCWMATGDYEQARTALEALVEAQPQDAEMLFRLGELHDVRGRTEAARDAWQRAVEAARGGGERSADQLAYAGKAMIALGGSERVVAASQFLVDALGLDERHAVARTALGELKFEVYGEAAGFPSGERDLLKVLEDNGDVEEALLALFRLRSANWLLDGEQTSQYLQRALQLNPNSVEALVLQADRIIDDRRFEDGAGVLGRALEINPRHRRALAHQAAVELLRGSRDKMEEVAARVLEIDPTYHEMWRVIGDHLVRLYRFEDALEFYQRALDGDPDDVEALHGIGKALIYTGNGERAVEKLERAKSLQPGYVNPWRTNALAVEELLRDEYEKVEDGDFVFHIHEADLGVLAAYLVPTQLAAQRRLDEKYGYRPEGKVRVEVYHRWVDFSVRTVGFRGFTALGACFGRFITLVSPVDRQVRQQDFMWAATVLHEYAHVLHLGLSNQRVPRWLTEGMAVHEERAKDPSWDRGMERDLYDAWFNDEIYPVRRINAAFRGPRILFGYYQGGLIADFIAEKHGFDKLAEMLRRYGQDQSTEQIFREVLGQTTAAFDLEFQKSLVDRILSRMKLVPRVSSRKMEGLLADIAEDPDDLQARVHLAWGYAQRDNPIDAGRQLAEALRRDPGHGPALLLRAELARRNGEVGRATELYKQGFATGAEDFLSRIQYGDMMAEAGDVDEAIRQYQLAKRCWPTCTDQALSPHLRIGKLLREQGQDDAAMMELKAFVERTGRAYAPRIQLAAYEKNLGNREAEAGYLQEAVLIDPFSRGLHRDLGDALVALGRAREALREYHAALAVPPALDRAFLNTPDDEIPLPDAPEQRLERAELQLRLARAHRALGERNEALRFLQQVRVTAPGTAVADDAARLEREWSGR